LLRAGGCSGSRGATTGWIAYRVDGHVIVIVVGGVGVIAAELDAAIIVRTEVAGAAHLDDAVDAYLPGGIGARPDLGRDGIRLVGVEGGCSSRQQRPINVVEEQLAGCGQMEGSLVAVAGVLEVGHATFARLRGVLEEEAVTDRGQVVV